MKRRIFLLTILVFGILSVLILHRYNQNRIVATVNGQQITNNDVTKICKQLDEYEDDYYSKVLNDIIDEYVVVLNADKVNVKVTENEINSCIQEYKDSFPDIYEKGKKLYGEKEFYKGIELQIIYNKVYEIVVSEQIENNRERLVEQFCFTYNNDHDMEISREEFISEYETEFEEYIFNLWVDEVKKDMNIIIYK